MQIGEEDRPALEDRDHHGLTPGVVLGDRAAELLHPAVDVLASEQDAGDLRHDGRSLAGARGRPAACRPRQRRARRPQPSIASPTASPTAAAAHHGSSPVGGGGGTSDTTSGLDPRRHARDRHLASCRPAPRGPAGTRRPATPRPARARGRCSAGRHQCVDRPRRRRRHGAATDRDGADRLPRPHERLLAEPLEPVVEQCGRVGERLVPVAEHHGDQSPALALGGRDQAEARRRREPGLHPDRARVQPQQCVAVLHAPRRPRGAGIVRNLDADDRGEPGLAYAARVSASRSRDGRSTAVVESVRREEPVSPQAERMRPGRSSARRSPARCRRPRSRARPRRRSPTAASARRAARGPCAAPPLAARASTTRRSRRRRTSRRARPPTTSSSSALPSTMSAVITFVRLAMGRRISRRLREHDLAVVEIGEDRRRRVDARRRRQRRAGVASDCGNGDGEPRGGTGRRRRARPLGRGGAQQGELQGRGTATIETAIAAGRRTRPAGAAPRLTRPRRSSPRFVRSSACLSLREVTERSASISAATRRASGFF